MSLKAKLEAVVYAAEEPVTLAQFAAIFADEVLPVQDEASPPVDEIAPEDSGQEPPPEQMALVDLPPDPGGAPATEAAPAVEAAEAVADEAALPKAGEGDEKKSARLRDRRVRQVLQGVIDELIADYAGSGRGMEIREIAGGYRMATKPEYHDAVRGFVKSLKPPMKLSLQALETLAVIAYKQPVTAPEVSEIRGVDSGGVLGGLVGRKLITTAGRKQVIGRPILYKTTKEFLLRFGLKDVNDLPSMEEFEKMAGELAESEAEGESQDVDLQSSEATHSGESGGAAGAESGADESQVSNIVRETVQEMVQETAHVEAQWEAEEPASTPAADAGEPSNTDHEGAPELTLNSVTGES